MLEFIAKYWIQIGFGLIVAFFAWFFKRYFKLEKKQIEEAKENFKNEILNKVEDDQEYRDNRLGELEEELDLLRIGLLSVQGRMYRRFCEKLLREDKDISVEEYEQEEEDYAAYKKLKGNHRGDALHAAVVTKFNNQVK